MNDQPSEVFVAGKKWFSNPEKITRSLLIERTIRMYASVDEEPLSVVVGEMQRTDPVDV
jgi:hypothetical protein